jgi:hypothetical protein
VTRFAAADGFKVAREFVEVETGKHAHHPLLTEFFRSGSSDPDDPRNAHKEQGVLPSSDPLTLGLHEGSYVIGDGLHRARTFLVASAPSTIAVYMPLR